MKELSVSDSVKSSPTRTRGLGFRSTRGVSSMRFGLHGNYLAFIKFFDCRFLNARSRGRFVTLLLALLKGTLLPLRG